MAQSQFKKGINYLKYIDIILSLFEKCFNKSWLSFTNFSFIFQAEVIAPSEELLNNQVINDFDIEEDEIEIENRLGNNCCFSFSLLL